jgi:predicted nucleic-acid-binding protein
LSGRAFVSVTVLLEFEWVLRGFYGLARREILPVLQALAGMAHVTLESRDEVLAALEACTDAKLDFADALHLLRSGRCAAFVTFDRRLVKRAVGFRGGPVVEQLS